jgi:Baseplate J-like protein
MSLPLPTLDNRTFDQLVAEGEAQINRLSPSWTNYNASDPGITLLELFAWLSEQNLYRTDRVSDEMVRAFLRLVDIEPAPPGVASTVALLATSGAEVALPERVQLSDPFGMVVFETRAAITVSVARLAQVLSAGSPPVDVTAANLAPYNASQDATAGSFLPFGAAPAPDAALCLGFDAEFGAPGAPVSLYVWTLTPDQDATTRAALIREDESDWRRHYSVSTIWEFYANDGSWRPLPDVEDETRALTLSGFVRFAAPSGQAKGGPGPMWFIRCRMTCGGFECAPRLDRVGVNAVVAEHAASIAGPEVVGVSRGHASESYNLASIPVVAGSTRLTLASGAARDDRWREAPQWDLVGPHDRRYVLQPELGLITTGNGMRGAVLPAGWSLLLDYRVGGGVAGNIAAGTLTGLASSAWNLARIPGEAAVAARLSATQPVAAFGGGAAETLAAAEARAVAAMAVPTRTVTLADTVTLARAVPGVPVARATALANSHPAVPCFTAPGCITVIVVPNCPGPAPMPTAGFLQAVARYLDRRRPVTTEVHVAAPTYVTIVVAATLQAASSADPTTLPALAQAALDRFLNPLQGGPSSGGWPIGRAVYRTEVITLLAALPGVLTVTGLTLQADSAAPVCGNIDICASELVRSGQHQVTATITGTTIFRRSRERECF